MAKSERPNSRNPRIPMWVKHTMTRLDALLSPRPEVTDPEQRQNARLLTVLSLGFVLLMIVAYIPNLAFYSEDIGILDVIFFILYNVVVITSFIMSRRGKTRTVSLLLVGLLTLLILGSVLRSGSSGAYVLYYLALPLLLANMLFSRRRFLALVFGCIGLLILLPSLNDSLSTREMPVFFVIALSITLLALHVHTTRIEKIRRTHISGMADRYRNLFDATSDAVIVHENHRIIGINPTFTRMLGYNTDEVIGRDIRDIVIVRPRPVYEIIDELQAEDPFIVEIYRKDKSIIQVEFAAWAYNEGGRTLSVTNIRDMSQRHLAQSRSFDLQIERERSNLLQRFINDASHDLRTPLTVIFSSLHLLKQTEDAAKRETYLSRLENQADNMQRMVENLLSISRLEKAISQDFHFVPGDLGALLHDLIIEIQPLAEIRRIDLSYDNAETIPTVLFDRDDLYRAIRQVIVNAINFTPDSGTVRVSVRYTKTDVYIDIKDTGIGIDSADIQHIFELFYRAGEARNADQGGMGLGLYIAQEIIAAHGGTITVNSTLDEGSTFFICLPVANVPLQPTITL